MTRHSVGPDLSQTVYEGYQQTTKVATSKESKALHFYPCLKKPDTS